MQHFESANFVDSIVVYKLDLDISFRIERRVYIPVVYIYVTCRSFFVPCLSSILSLKAISLDGLRSERIQWLKWMVYRVECLHRKI